MNTIDTKVVVNFLTFTPSMDHPRVQYAEQCLNALFANLTFDKGELLYHIADDGSPKEHVDKLLELAKDWGIEPTVSNSNRSGYGGNFNTATQYTHSLAEFVIPIEEDWELVRPFDISSMIKAIQEDTRIECIRLGYLGWTEDLKGKLVQSAAQTFLLFDADSPETHVFAGHPRIETVAFEKRIGEWPVGIKAGWTEMDICKRKESRTGVAWPLDAGINASQDYCRLFAHVGDVQS